MGHIRPGSMSQVFGVALLLLLTIETAFLIKQNHDLKGMLKNGIVASDPEPLKPGEQAQPIKIQTLDGAMSNLSYADPSKKYLLFVLSTTCPHCEKNLTKWKKIAGESSPERCNIIGLSIHTLDQTRGYVARNDIGFYLTSVSSDTGFTRKYKITAVPETILLKGDGTVEKVWVGELTADQAKEVQKLASI